MKKYELLLFMPSAVVLIMALLDLSFSAMKHDGHQTKPIYENSAAASIFRPRLA